MEVGVPNTPLPSFGGVPLGRMLTPPAGVLSLATAASRMAGLRVPGDEITQDHAGRIGSGVEQRLRGHTGRGEESAPWLARTPMPLSFELLGAVSVTTMSGSVSPLTSPTKTDVGSAATMELGPAL